MKTKRVRRLLYGLLVGGSGLFGEIDDALAQNNSWTNSASGKWEAGVNWSLGLAPSNNHSVFITNSSSKVVIIDAATAATPTMTVSNVTVSAPAGSTNTLMLANSGTSTPLTILGSFNIPNGGALIITNASVVMPSFWTVGGLTNSGDILLNTGRLIVTNGISMDTFIGYPGTGSLAVSNGTAIFNYLHIGFYGGRGTFTLGGGSTDCYTLQVGLNGTGTVWVTGGTLTTLNANLAPVGITNIVSAGQMTMSNGTWNVSLLSVYDRGTLSLVGGTVTGPNVYVGASGTGTVWMTGGELSTTYLVVGDFGVGRMTVSNGTWSSFQTYVGNSSSGTFTVAGGTGSVSASLFVGYFGTGLLTLTGGSLAVQSNLTVAVEAAAGGAVVVAGGSLSVGGTLFLTNANGGFIFNSGTVSANGVNQGNGQTFVVGSGGAAHLTLSSGTHQFANNLVLGNSLSSTGTLVVAGGDLILTNGNNLRIGGDLISFPSRGYMFVSNGTVLAQNIYVGGQSTGGNGTLTIAGGAVNATTLFDVGDFGNSPGTVWVAGGNLIATNNLILGNSGPGSMTISNGAVLARTVNIASTLFSLSGGTLTVAGGTMTVLTNLIVGYPNCTPVGTVIVAGGELDVTNATGTAVFDVRSGSVTLNSGTLHVDRLVVSNVCSHFFLNGGTLVSSTNILTAAFDADADGMPNGYEQSNGLNPLDPNDAGLDTDGDGLSNLQEFLAGTSPTNSASAFRITSIVKTNIDIRVTWMTGIGKTNALQRSSGTVAGSYSNNFTVIFTVTNTVGTTTNYLDVGAETNYPSLYYRVRLVP